MRSTRAIDWLFLLMNLAVIFGRSVGKNEYTRLFERCSNEKNTFDCLKQRALEILDSAIHDDSVYVINDFLSIGRDPAAYARSSQETLRRENGTEMSLDEKLDSKFYEYLSSRSIRLTIPGTTFEGRKKKGKGYGGLVLGGLALAGMMAHLAYGKIAFMAGTALLTAKIALVLSAIIGLKKLVANGGGGHEVIYATASDPHGGGGGGYGGGYSSGWQRNFETIPPT